MEQSECDALYTYLSKGVASYTLAIMARTKREYLGEKLRILAELTMVN